MTNIDDEMKAKLTGMKKMLDRSLKAVNERYGIRVQSPEKVKRDQRSFMDIWIPGEEDWRGMCEVAGIEATEEGRLEWIQKELEAVWTAVAALPEVGLSMNYACDTEGREFVQAKVTYTPVTQVLMPESHPDRISWIWWMLMDSERMFTGSEKMREAAYEYAMRGSNSMVQKMYQEAKDHTPAAVERSRMMDELIQAL